MTTQTKTFRLGLAAAALAILLFAGIGIYSKAIGGEKPENAPQPAVEAHEHDHAAHADETKPIKAKVGKPAPDFNLKDIDGKDHQLSSVKGRVVVLVWTNPDCPFVKAHNAAGTVEKLNEKFDDEQVVFALIDSTHDGSIERTRKTNEKYEIKTPTLLDFDGRVGEIYGAKTTPHTFVIDKEGILVYQGALDNAPMGKAPKGEEVVNYAEQAVNALLAGKQPEVKSSKPYGCPVKYKD